MKCLKCQFENPADVRFCVECGVKLEVVCPECGAPNAPSFKFCGRCGHDLRRPEAAPIDYTQPRTYTPKPLADRILTARQSIEGERKLVTVFFADVANYTAMSEKLDSEEVRQIMDGCFKIIMDSVYRYEGTIDKFTGDGVMALFGAPLAHEDHAQRACYAALATQKAMGMYGDEVKRDCGVDFKMRIGLNSGPVIVGTVGNDLRMDYTAVGDTVNLASRMETLAQPATTLVSQDTYRMARDFFKFHPLGKVQVKGRKESVEAFELVESAEVSTRIEAAVLKGLTKFVGREREMATLKEAFDKAKSGSGQVVCIVGEAGVGKSRLLLELRGSIEREETTYLEGHCLHYGSSMPYLPLLDILRSCFGLKEGEREFLTRKRLEEKILSLDQKLKSILPPLQELLSLKVEDEAYLKLEPQKKRERIFEAIRDLLMVESQQRPLIVAVEDLHWIDKTSEEFLSYLIGHLPSSRILLLLLYRPEYTHQWGSKSCYSQVRVDELPTKSSADLVRAMLEEGEVAPELRELILNRAAGNPLFMEEFTHTLLENGSIGKKDHKYVLTRKASEIQVPDTIQGIVAARMDRLDDNLKRIMQVASVIGRDFAYRILQTITGMQEELKSHLINLQGLEFIYEKRLFPELEYVFKHALTQEVAYNSLLVKRRKEIHERIGRAIEEIYPDRLEELCEVLAYHYSASDNLDKAYQYLRASMEKSLRNYSNIEAYRLFKEAIAVLKRLPDTEHSRKELVQVTLLMSWPLVAMAYPEGSLDVLTEGQQLAEALGDEKRSAHLMAFVGLCHSYRGESRRGLEYLEKALDQAERIEDIQLLAHIATGVASAHFFTGQMRKLAVVAEKVIAVVENADKPLASLWSGTGEYSELLTFHGLSKGFLGEFEGGYSSIGRARDLALAAGERYSLLMVDACGGWISCTKGDWQDGLERFRDAIKGSEETHIVMLDYMARAGAGWCHYLQGDLKAAVECCDKAMKGQEASGIPVMASALRLLKGVISLDSGDLKSARSEAEEALRLSLTNNERHFEGNVRIWLGRIIGKSGTAKLAEAEECILQGMKILHELETKPWEASGYLFLGELYADAGQEERAIDQLEKARTMFQKMGMDYYLAKAEKVLEKLGK